MSSWMLVNVNRDMEKKRDPFDLEEVTAWLGYSRQYVKPVQVTPLPAPESPDEIKRRLGIVYMLHKATSRVNGERG